MRIIHYAKSQLWRDPMIYSNRTRSCADEIVNAHAKYDALVEEYCLDLDSIPDASKKTLAYHIFLDNPELLDNACSVENDAFNAIMVPSLMVFLKHKNEISTEDFLNRWTKGVVEYVEKHMRTLINDSLYDYNEEIKNPTREPE
jgi:(2Fe-2S) ferredoxin